MLQSIDKDAYLFNPVTVFGQPALLLRGRRLDRSALPKGLYCYDIRHSDCSRLRPVTVEPVVFVNHYGCLITRLPLDFGELKYKYLPHRFRVLRCKTSINQFLRDYGTSVA